MALMEPYFIGLKSKNKYKRDNAFNKLMEHYYNYVYTKIAVKVRNKEDVRDLTADVFLVLYKKLDEINSSYSIFSYLDSIVDNTLRHYFSRIKPKNDKLEAFEDYENKYTYYNDEVFKYLMHLNKDEELIIRLKVIHEYTFQDIAKYMKISIGKVHYLYKQAIEKLANMLEGK